MIRRSAGLHVAMVAYSYVGVSRATVRLPSVRITGWRGPVVRVPTVAPWPAHLGAHAGHCIHHHRRRAIDYRFAACSAALDGTGNVSRSPRTRAAGAGATSHLRWLPSSAAAA